jgi:hypothetical protein
MARRRAAQCRDATIVPAKPDGPKRIKVDDRPKMGADGWREDWPEKMKSDIFRPSRLTPWRSMPKGKALNQDPNTRRFVQWMRLTHNGRRTVNSLRCTKCGAVMTEEDIAEFNALRAQRLSP